MELKLLLHTVVCTLFFLLIVPYGIETFTELGTTSPAATLLIVPYGIET